MSRSRITNDRAHRITRRILGEGADPRMYAFVCTTMVVAVTSYAAERQMLGPLPCEDELRRVKAEQAAEYILEDGRSHLAPDSYAQLRDTFVAIIAEELGDYDREVANEKRRLWPLGGEPSIN